MIITQEVEGRVEDQLLELPDHGVTLLFGLPSRRVQRNHDLPEQPPAVRQHVPIGERQNIGRRVAAEVVPVELANPVVAGHQNVDLAGPAIQALETRVDRSPAADQLRGVTVAVPS